MNAKSLCECECERHTSSHAYSFPETTRKMNDVGNESDAAAQMEHFSLLLAFF